MKKRNRTLSRVGKLWPLGVSRYEAMKGICLGLLSVGFAASPTVAQTIGVDYGGLNAQQRALFQSYSGCLPSTCPELWEKLNSSQQLEFAGSTQALGTITLQPSTVTGLDQVDALLQIHGSEPNQQSQDQFNVETKWKTSAPDQFADALGWSEHIAILHKGQYGYQENREDNPFLGLVVLFDKHPDPRKGQFHIDFRSWFAHYCPDNGNISANYDEYITWYGRIPGYTPIFKYVFPQLTRDNLLVDSRQPSASAGQALNCTGEIQGTVQKFLTAWYVDRDFASLLDFVAHDNVYNAANLDSLGVKSPLALWSRLFSDAFESPSKRISTLESALEYHEPIFRDPAKRLRYVNSEPVSSGAARYAIIDPDSAPAGSLFPRVDMQTTHNVQRDVQARFLEHLQKTYRDKLYVVIYATAGPSLVHETAVQYWIREGNCWKLSAFQGTNW